MLFESESVEFKENFTDNIFKSVVAFANTDGGVIQVGVDNNGNVIGLEDVDGNYTKITNGIREIIEPDVTMFVKSLVGDDRVINIVVKPGTNKPYKITKNGNMKDKFYVRQGASSVPASFEHVRKMIRESYDDIFEIKTSILQELSFNEAKNMFELQGIEFNQSKYINLGVKNKKDDVYTNLALLMSDQCEHSIKVASYSDEDQTIFRDQKEFSGSVFKQLKETIDYLELCNKKAGDIKGFIRSDKYDYPPEAIREALLNAIVHRDYSYSGSILINITDIKIEFISIGGLINDITKDDILLGISQPRNKNLTEVFHRLRFIESYGTGLRRIYRLYENCPKKPQIEVTSHAFKITLPNMREATP